MLSVTEGRHVHTIEQFATHLHAHGCPAEQIESVSIDMSPAFIKGCTDHLPNARITFELREILQRKQINVVRTLLRHWCTCVMRSKVEPMKEVAALVRRHLEGIVAWAQTRQTNGFLEAINGLFQAAKRRARGFTRLSTIKTVIFLIAGKLDFRVINPHVPQPT